MVFISGMLQSICAKFEIISNETNTQSHNSLGAGQYYYHAFTKKLGLNFLKLNKNLDLSIKVRVLSTTANIEVMIH